MKSLVALVVIFSVFSAEVSAQTSCADSCEPRNRSVGLGSPSAARSSILSDSSCSLRLVLKSPAREEEMSIPSGIVERGGMGVTFSAPFNKISDMLLLSISLQSDLMFPAATARGARETLATLKNMEDDPALGMRWSFVYRAPAQPQGEDRISLRATWRNRSSSSGFSMTEVRLSPSNFALWCR